MRFWRSWGPQDRFNIVTFGTTIQQFKPDLVEAHGDHIAEARQFVHNMSALGLTHISDAFIAGLGHSYSESHLRNLIFLTDGRPTVGVTHPDSVVNLVTRINTEAVRIYSFGVGENLNKPMLTQLFNENHGYATFIASNDSIALPVKNHFVRMSKPVMTDLAFDFGGLNVHDRYPRMLTDLYWGRQVLEMGRYSGGGSFDVTLSGQVGAEPVAYTETFDFSSASGGYRFVPRLWAQTKIAHLLNLIEMAGEVDELVDQVMALSLTYQILTPYTAMWMDPDEPTDPDPGDGGIPAASVKREGTIVPVAFRLFANYPNPFNMSTRIRYALPMNKSQYAVKILIYDALGRLVATLVNELQMPGLYSVEWNGFDANGQVAPSGVYQCVVEAGEFRAVQRLVVVK